MNDSAETTETLSKMVNYENLVMHGKNPDVTFFFPNDSGARLAVEKHKLSNISEVFKKLLPQTENAEHGGDRIEITDIKFGIFSRVVAFIYGEDLKISAYNYSNILYMAKKYFLFELIHKIVNFLLGYINEANIFYIFEDIAQYDINTLNVFMKKVCVSEPITIMMSLKAHKPAHKQILQIILESPCLPCSEYDLYAAIVTIYENEENCFDIPKFMREQLGNLIYLIRFPTMTKEEIIKCAKYPSLITNDQVVDFLLWIQEKTFTNSLQFFSSEPRVKCSCQEPKAKKQTTGLNFNYSLE